MVSCKADASSRGPTVPRLHIRSRPDRIRQPSVLQMSLATGVWAATIGADLSIRRRLP